MTAVTDSLTEKLEPAYRLLVIDDNRDLVEFLKVLFTHHGYTVEVAFNGPDGLAMVRKQSFDVVLLDVMMPGMDGLKVCAELKKINPTLPVLLLTAKDDLATRSAAMTLGVSEFLAKPVNIEDLLTRVSTQCHVARWDHSVSTSPASEKVRRHI